MFRLIMPLCIALALSACQTGKSEIVSFTSTNVQGDFGLGSGSCHPSHSIFSVSRIFRKAMVPFQ